MTTVAIAVFVVLAGLAGIQFFPALAFWSALKGRRRPLPEACPKTAVILCLRGCDPFLAACLESLFDQDHPAYDVWIVVDSREDPAWSVVESVIEAVVARRGAANVVVRPLEQRFDTCALKCSSLIQAISSLDETYEAVALTDGDALLHRTWLRELVAPLADPQIGVASGNRWYMPAAAGLGSLIRYVWNVAAVVQMYLNRFTWGGSVALRAEVFRDPQLIERWRSAVSSDTVIYRVVRRHGLRAAFVPSLMMVNRETCRLGQFYGWVQRQLAVGRWYHPGWPIVLLHGLTTTAALAVAVGVLVAALATGRWTAAAWVGGGLLLFEAAMLALVALLERAVRGVVRARGEAVAWLSPVAAVKLLAAIPLTQIVYAAALIKATFLRTVEWRGVAYRIDGPWNVRLVHYEPFRSEPPSAHSTSSV